MRGATLHGLWLLCLLCAGCASSARVRGIPTPPELPRDAYVEGLVERALELELDQEAQWLRLGHYRRGVYAGGLQSENDSPRFFVSPDGKADPRAELVETIRAFFRPPVAEPAVGVEGPPRHALCRFPARFAYLSNALGVDLGRLPAQRCPRFAKFVQDLNPRSVTLVFSSYYLNNPSSAFGHTFLRFNGAQPHVVGKRRELLDQAVGFAADVDTANALLYAFKGVFGMFPGTFTRRPYYYKVREYNDFENRDLWSYELDLTPRQLFILVSHLWELGATHFNYFYLDENCSYRLNRVLEAALPERDLTSTLHIPVIPADTIKAVMRNEGLVRSVTFRPSLRTRFRHATANMTAPELDTVSALSLDAAHALPDGWSVAQKAAVLDAAVDLYDIHHAEALLAKEDVAVAEHKRRLLSRRAALRVRLPERDPTPSADELPHRVHATHRGGVGGGLRGADRPFVSLDFRLAAHDLADPSPGFPALSQLEFFPTRLRIFPRRNRLQLSLEDFQLVRIVSLNAVDRFDMGISWHIAAGAQTLRSLCGDCLAGTIRGGTGLAYGEGDGITVFGLVDLSMAAADADIGFGDGPIRLGTGPVLGTRVALSPQFILLARGELLYHPAQPDALWPAGRGTLRWAPTSDYALSLEGGVDLRSYEAQLMTLVYF